MGLECNRWKMYFLARWDEDYASLAAQHSSIPEIHFLIGSIFSDFGRIDRVLIPLIIQLTSIFTCLKQVDLSVGEQ